MTVVRKNFHLTGRNLGQNQTQCRWSSAATTWEGEELERKKIGKEDRENVEAAEAAGSRQGRGYGPGSSSRTRVKKGGGRRSSNMLRKCCKKMEHKSSGGRNVMMSLLTSAFCLRLTH